MRKKPTKTNNAMRPCAVRLPIGLYNYVLQEADDNGTSIGEVIRNACNLMRENTSMVDRLGRLENRILRKVFEAQCVVVGLSETERDNALKDLKTRLKELAK